jgi:adenylate cyclase
MVVVFLPCTAQKQGQALIDSLLAELPGTAEDTHRVRLLNDLAYFYAYVDPDEGIKRGKEAMALATQLGWELGVGNAYRSIGSNYANKSDYAKALEYEYTALRIFEHLKNVSMQGIMWQNLGIVQHRSKNQEKALEYYQRALALFEQTKDTLRIASIYSNMANAYYSLGEADKVLEYDLKALHTYEEKKDKAGVARLLGNIGNFYAEEGNYALAMVYYFDALRKETAMGNEDGVTRNLGNIGETYLDISQDTTRNIQPDSLIPAGRVANLAKALTFLKTTVEKAQQLQQTEYYLAFGEVLSEAYMLTGNTAEALRVYQEYITVRDSVYDVEKVNEAMRKQLDYEYGKREDSIQYAQLLSNVKLEDEKRLRSAEKLFFISGLVLVLVFSIFMFNRWRVTQRQKQIIEREKKRSDELLLNILPEETANELKEKGHSDARLIEQVTVLFTDFKDFTQLSEEWSPQQLVAEINHCFSAFDRIMEKYGVEKIKTIGDAYMAAGGLPTPNNTHAVDVVHAALDVQQFMNSRLEEKRSAGEPYFEIRIGINTGPVVAGIVGIKKFQYDIWGDTVNTASRMESSSEVGKVNVSAYTYELVKNHFRCTYRGKIDAKHKGEVDMYFVEKA